MSHRLLGLFAPPASGLPGDPHAAALGARRPATAGRARCASTTSTPAGRACRGCAAALERLRAAGKRVWVHLERAGVSEYYLASGRRAGLAGAGGDARRHRPRLRGAVRARRRSTRSGSTPTWSSRPLQVGRRDVHPAPTCRRRIARCSSRSSTICSARSSTASPPAAASSPPSLRDVLGRGPFVAAEAQRRRPDRRHRLCRRGRSSSWSRRAAAPPCSSATPTRVAAAARCASSRCAAPATPWRCCTSAARSSPARA